MSEPTKNKIRDNPSLKKLEQDIKLMGCASWVVAFFEKLGIYNEKISQAMKQIPDLEQQLEDIIDIPDKFNAYFSNLGWVAYNDLDMNLMKQAIALAEEGNSNKAEQLLIDYYDEPNINFKLARMRFIPEFKPRERLLRLALDDYINERYYACIPIILANIDGLTNDIFPTGFFAQNTDLTAPDSIGAHSSGLSKLKQYMNARRMKTSEEQLSIPYRNGIMHGHDLGYDNKMVAAKSWATLFALQDLIIAIRKPKTNIDDTPTSMREAWQQIKDVAKKLQDSSEEITRFNQWKPRKLTVGDNVPQTGLPKDYSEGSPEQTFTEFMMWWTKKNYGYMAKLLISLHDKGSIGRTAGWIKNIFEQVTLVKFVILSVEDFASAVTIIDVKITYTIDTNENETEFKVRVLYEDEKGNSVSRGNPKGNWKLLISPFIGSFSLYPE